MMPKVTESDLKHPVQGSNISQEKLPPSQREASGGFAGKPLDTKIEDPKRPTPNFGGDILEKIEASKLLEDKWRIMDATGQNKEADRQRSLGIPH